MYNTNRPRGASSGRRHTGYHYDNRNNTRRYSNIAKRHGIKKLDQNLFVNKATISNQPEAEYVAQHQFKDFDLINPLKLNIANKGYSTPTPIQDQAIPLVLQGSDVIGIANTGTGKTAAFLVPLINKIHQNKSEKVLIVAPTRELAMQINEELRDFVKGMGIYSVLTIGGASMHRQRHELTRQFNFVIGTPGRLKDLIRERALDLSTFHNIVLDEVDRMVDIGFIRDIEFLISHMPRERQSLFFSATVTSKTDQILKQFVSNPVTVSVKTHTTAETVEQDIIKVTDATLKIDILHDLLIKDGFDKVMVFGRTKWGIEKLTRSLIDRGFKAASIHGNKSQGQRQRALKAFKDNEVQVLLATDVASRGIDVQDVTHVINYDAPESHDDYIHRIGRTGRANKKGMAITFVE